jgi:phosphoglycerate dehydrogenase-like enzyme
MLPEYFTNAAGAYGTAISEHLITMALMLQRHMAGYIENAKKREWKYLGKVRSVHGSTVTIAGLGDIGSCLAEKMHAMGADIKVITRKERWGFPSYISEACLSSNTAQTDRILSMADIIALCMPHTPETINFISAERIKKLKPGVIILNAGRGSAIDEEALADGLESGHIGGAGLDVTAVEPLPASSRLWGCPNIIITPHVSGGSSLDYTFELIFDKFIKYLGDYINGRPFAAAVDKTAGY